MFYLQTPSVTLLLLTSDHSFPHKVLLDQINNSYFILYFLLHQTIFYILFHVNNGEILVMWLGENQVLQFRFNFLIN